MAYAPCKNPNCKSFGTAHPNCRCYAEMAHGGDVNGHFCSDERDHQPGCIYHHSPDRMPAFHEVSEHVAHFIAHGGFHGLLDLDKDSGEGAIERYHLKIHRGKKAFENKIENIFKGSDNGVSIPASKYQTVAKKQIEDWIDKGGIGAETLGEVERHANVQHLAGGGEVKEKPQGVTHENPIGSMHPEQNVMMAATKSRVSQYLNSLKPQKNMPRLPFDREPDQTEKRKEYDKALQIAAHPLSIMDSATQGNIKPQELKHFEAMYPDMKDVLQKKITQRIIEAQMKGEKPNYKTRQSLSLIMGTPLSSELSPETIQAAQAVFSGKRIQAQASAPQQPQRKSPTSGKALTHSDQAYLTSPQSRVKRDQDR